MLEQLISHNPELLASATSAPCSGGCAVTRWVRLVRRWKWCRWRSSGQFGEQSPGQSQSYQLSKPMDYKGCKVFFQFDW